MITLTLVCLGVIYGARWAAKVANRIAKGSNFRFYAVGFVLVVILLLLLTARG